jgi:hypothetical protein
MNNCTIYNKSFLDDLIDIKNSINDASILETKLSELISASPHEDNIWTPLILDSSLSNINKKLVLDNGTATGYNNLPSILGIQDFLTINNPTFNFWNVTNGVMVTDWILNNPNSSYIPIFGLLCWFKKITPTQNYRLISTIPNNSRVLLSGTSRVFIKIDNDILYEINDSNKNSARFTTSSINFAFNENNSNNNYVKISDLGNNPQFIVANTFLTENRGLDATNLTENIYSEIAIGENRYLLWVPNGDVYSYYLNLDERFKQNNVVAPRSFVSSALYQNYNAIYHQLNIDNIKTFNRRSTHIARCYKNLAKYLASSPYIDEFSISRFSDDDVKNFVNAFISTNGDKNNTLSCLNNISTYLKNTIFENDISNINNNIIYSYNSLKQKIAQKYGSRLSLSGNASITTKNNLSNGANIVVGQIGDYYIGSTTADTTISCNQTIGVGSLEIKTNFTNSSAIVELLSPIPPGVDPEVLGRNKIEFYNGYKAVISKDNNNFVNLIMEKTTNNPELPEFNDVSLINNPDNVIFKYVQFTPRSSGSRGRSPFITDFIKFNVVLDDFKLNTYRGSEDAFNPFSVIAKEEILCSWEKVSGPPLKFININLFYQSPNQGPIVRIGSENRDRFKISDVSNTEIAFSKLSGPTEVYVVPSISGRYQIKCTISTPFGTFTKIKTFYVVYGQDFLIAKSGSMIPSYAYEEYANVGYGSFNTGIDRSDLVTPNIEDIEYIRTRESNPIYLNNDDLRVNVPYLRKIALNSNGLFWPINTNLYVKPVRSRPFLLNNNSIYQFPFRTRGSSAPSLLSINYSLNNLTYKLDRIILEKTRVPNDTSCYNCLSFYNPQLYGSNGRWYRKKSILIESFDVESATSPQQSFRIPDISTDYSPPIKPYGGYDTKIINDVGVILPDHSASDEIFPYITGQPLDYKSDNPTSDPPFYTDDSRKFCFEQLLPYPANNYLTFEKGVFHPYSGWIQNNSPLYNDVKNLSSVLKFNPGARDSFSFNGPSIDNLTNDSYIYDNNITYIIPKNYKSTIDLSISVGAQWIQWGKNCSETTRPGQRLGSPPDWKWRNQIHREITDQLTMNIGEYTNHGYRILEGGRPKWIEFNNQQNFLPVMDEFGVDNDENQNKFSYRFPTSGPHYPIDAIPSFVTEYWSRLSQQPADDQPGANFGDISYAGLDDPDPSQTWVGIKNPRVLGFNIKDLEVKLNFLNYINTKDLSISFESIPAPDEQLRISPFGRRPLDTPIQPQISFIDQTIPYDIFSRNFNENIFINNGGLSSYLRELDRMNTRYLNGEPNVSAPLRLYLLNQEHIQNHSVNLSLKFSDNADKNTVFCDQGFSKDRRSYQPQQIIHNNESIRPSTSPNNHSDRESYLYNKITTKNKLNIINNTFSKYRGKTLFNSTPPCFSENSPTTESPNNDGVSTFSCNITLYDEHDDMLFNDNTIDSQMFTNAYDFDGKINTSQFVNALCSWELILHVSDTSKPTATNLSSLHSYGNNEALSLIDYGRPPSYPGYSFIANLRNYKHLLPFVNINAPNIFFQDYSLCESSVAKNIGKSSKSYNLEYPSLAVIQILGAMAQAAGMVAAGGLAGVGPGLALGAAGASAGYAAIVGFFNDARQQRFEQAVANEAYHQEYGGYPFGSPEKILINFSKDNVFWYKAEASIFKYQHTPVLKYKQYNYIRLNKDSFPLLSRFTFDIIKNIEELIDESYVQNLSIKCSEYDLLNGPQNINNVSYYKDSLVRVSFEQDTDEPCPDGLYIVNEVDNQWIPVSGDPLSVYKNTEYILQNHVMYYDTISTDHSIFKNFDEYSSLNKIIILDNDIPYNIFDINEQVIISGENIESIATVLGKALIYKDKKPYSVLKLDTDMSDIDFISPDNNVVVMFDLSSSSDIINNPINMYGFEKESINTQIIPEIFSTTNSVGSYGDGSQNLDKKLLSVAPSYNNLSKLYNAFNNKLNDKFKYNNMVFTTNDSHIDYVRPGTLLRSDIQSDQIKYIGKSKAFAYNIKDINIFIEKTNNYIINNASDELIDIINKELIYNNITNNNSYHFIYVKNNNFKENSIISNDFGFVSVEDDYEIKNPIQAIDNNGNIISDEIFLSLITKLNKLEDLSKNEFLESMVGKERDTNSIILSYNLNYLFQHYESLTEYNQAKQRTEFALRVLYKERDDILELLGRISSYQTAIIALLDDSSVGGKILSENNEKIIIDNNGEKRNLDKTNIKNIVRNFNRNLDLNYIRPKEKAIVNIKTGNDSVFAWLSSSSVYNISYEENNDDYWINLDPNQACSIAEELRPKVLKEISYICRPLNYQQTIFGTPFLSENNICARKRGGSLNAQDPVVDGVGFATSSIRLRGELYEMYTYTMNPNDVDSQKTDIENKARAANLAIKWNTKNIRRDYHINGENSFDYYNNQEVLVAVIETYEILLAPHEITDGKINVSNRMDADVSTMGTGENASVPSLLEGYNGARRPSDSPDGFGLLDGIQGGFYFDERTEQSVKIYNVCNLDEINTLQVKIRKIPRQLRGIDLLSSIYRYGATVPFSAFPRRTNADPLNPEAPGGAGIFGSSKTQPHFPIVNNNFYYWKCMELNGTGDRLIESTTPLFFQLMNEMMYRTFYGSVDKIENKYDQLVSQFLWELIPYEYFTRPPPEPQQ